MYFSHLFNHHYKHASFCITIAQLLERNTEEGNREEYLGAVCWRASLQDRGCQLWI